MMKRRVTCFFCYSWDNEELFNILSLIKDKIEEMNSEITVILDKRNYRYNDNFDEKLDRIRNYDITVVFFTPEFKSLIINENVHYDREILKEYSVIKERFEEDENTVFPVILSGTKETAIPDCFLRRNCPNISDWRIKNIKDEKQITSKQGEKYVDKFFTDLIGQTKYNHYYKSIDYENALQAIEKLFWHTNTTKLPQDCLVRIDTYPKVMNQESIFVVGRKGSGKSTFINNLMVIDKEQFNKKYKSIVPIIAENINHDFVYNNLIKKHKSDNDILPSRDMLTVFWQLYIILQSILTIGVEIEDGRITDIQRKDNFMRVINRFKDLLSLKYSNGKYKSLKQDGLPKSIFMLVAETIDEQYRIAIDRASEKNIYASFLVNMNVVSILEEMFGREMLEQFACELGRCTKKIIIALDGFDTYSEEFRSYTRKLSRDSDEYGERTDYERTFYRTLVEVVTGFNNSEIYDPLLSTFQEYLDFCIVLPKDRFDQVMDIDRDSTKKKFCSMIWDAYDLLELIVRRLEYLILTMDKKFYINHEMDYFERFERALDFFPTIPKKVMINVDGHNMKMDLFNYILRFSFWRPRDIISNFASILAYAIVNDVNGGVSVINNSNIIDNEMLKLTLKSNARKILQKDLLSEYENVFSNLNYVLGEFSDCDLIMHPEMFCNRLAKIRFDASYAYNLDKVSDKLYVLYQLGLIGLFFDKKTAQALGYLSHICYIFNAGLEPILDFKNKEDYENAKAKIIFNPILCGKLSLEINTNELLCNWDKSYIITLHKMKSIILES